MVHVPAAARASGPVVRLRPEDGQPAGGAHKSEGWVVLKASVSDELFRFRVGWPISVAEVRARVLDETGASLAEGRPLQLWRRSDEGGFEELPWNILSRAPSRPLHLFLEAAKAASVDAPPPEALSADATAADVASAETAASHSAETESRQALAPASAAAERSAETAASHSAETEPRRALAPASAAAERSAEAAASNGADPEPQQTSAPAAATSERSAEAAASNNAGLEPERTPAPAAAAAERSVQSTVANSAGALPERTPASAPATAAAEAPATFLSGASAGSLATAPAAAVRAVASTKPAAIVGNAARWVMDKLTAIDEAAEVRSACAASEALKKALEASKAEARERLSRVLKLYQARLKSVEGDGNCQYRALSAQLYGEEAHHAALRQRVVRQLTERQERYAPYVQGPFEEYLERMSREGEWGDNVTLQAACDVLGCEIRVLTDMPGSECVELRPAEPALGARQRGLCLAFVTEVHYDAVEFDCVD